MTPRTAFRLTEDDLSQLEKHRVALGAPNATAALRMLLHGPQAQPAQWTMGVLPEPGQVIADVHGKLMRHVPLPRPNLAQPGSRLKQPKGKAK